MRGVQLYSQLFGQLTYMYYERWESGMHVIAALWREYVNFTAVSLSTFHVPEKMKFFSWLSCILVAVAAVDAKDPPTELEIETTYKPDSCPYKAKKRDYIHVHYVSRYTCIAIF